MKNRKGIILSGGTGSRLWPLTNAISKHLLPIYDKPMIYYPLTTLMLAGIKEILIITTPEDNERFIKILGNGDQWGISLKYDVQEQPRGIAEAFIIGKRFLNGSPSALILADNLFFGASLTILLQNISNLHNCASAFAYHVKEPQRFGVCEFDEKNTPIRIVEKPKTFISSWAVTGLYFYDQKVTDIAEGIRVSPRGELEITEINQEYLKLGELNVNKMSRGIAWLDVGTHESLYEASTFVRSISKTQDLKIGCPEEIAWRLKLITTEQLREFVATCKQPEYVKYLNRAINSI